MKSEPPFDGIPPIPFQERQTAEVTDWQQVARDTWRIEVPGGYLYRYWFGSHASMCFVPNLHSIGLMMEAAWRNRR